MTDNQQSNDGGIDITKDRDWLNNINEPRENEHDMNEIVEIEQINLPQTRKQTEIMTAITEYGCVADDGSLDITNALPYINSQRGYAEETFGKYGRVVRYATDVDDPSIEVVREPSGRGGEQQAAVFELIDEYGTLNPDGSVDVGSIATYGGKNGKTYDRKSVARNVGRAVQVQMPWEKRPENTTNSYITKSYNENTGVGGTFDDPVLNQLFDESYVPSDPIAAFRRGWNLRDRLVQDEGEV